MDISKLESLKPEQVTPEIKRAVAAFLLAKTYAELKREEVDAVKREELATVAYMVAPEHREDGKPERITDPKRDWLMPDEDFKDYLAQCEKVELERGIRPADMKPGYCPALVAESLLTDAERVLVAATEPLTGVKWDNLVRYLTGHDKLATVEWCELWAKIVVSLPDFRNPLTGKAA